MADQSNWNQWDLDKHSVRDPRVVESDAVLQQWNWSPLSLFTDRSCFHLFVDVLFFVIRSGARIGRAVLCFWTHLGLIVFSHLLFSHLHFWLPSYAFSDLIGKDDKTDFVCLLYFYKITHLLFFYCECAKIEVIFFADYILLQKNKIK